MRRFRASTTPSLLLQAMRKRPLTRVAFFFSRTADEKHGRFPKGNRRVFDGAENFYRLRFETDGFQGLHPVLESFLVANDPPLE
jgi:hypothetical protein